MLRIRFVLAFAVAGVLLAAPFANGATSTVVVSQLFAGGGNAGAPYTNDFVELVNRGGTAVDVSGWTVQYASAASAGWQSTALTGSIQPGRYYLVQLASTAAVGAPLPTPWPRSAPASRSASPTRRRKNPSPSPSPKRRGVPESA